MELAQLKPSTLAGIKQLAKQLKKRDGIIHGQALDAAAKQAGWTSYREAHAALAEQGRVQ